MPGETVIEHATMRAGSGQEIAIAQALTAALAVVASAEGCLGTSLLHCIERPDEFVLRVVWTSVQAHHDFRSAAIYSTYRKHLPEHLGEVVGFAHYTEISTENGDSQ